MDKKLQNITQIIKQQKMDVLHLSRQQKIVNANQDVHHTSLWAVIGVILTLTVIFIIYLIKVKLDNRHSNEYLPNVEYHCKK